MIETCVLKMQYVQRKVTGSVDLCIALRSVYIESDNLCLNQMSVKFTEEWKFTRNESVQHTHWAFTLLL
jgi:hypothetical protein